MKCIISSIAGWFLFARPCSPLYAAQALLRVHFIDVGYGDAILVELPDEGKVLIDAGDAPYAARLTEYLTDHKIKNLEMAILTHPHKNHFDGFLSVIEGRAIGKFYDNGDVHQAEEGYDRVVKGMQDKDIPMAILKEGDELCPGNKNVCFSVLHPSELTEGVNEDALVLRITYKEVTFLLTSDIQNPQQEELISRYPQLKSADVVQVPHHGGRIADNFAEFFGKGAIFIVSTGPNEYGKPYTEELDKLKGKVYRTDVHGPIVLQSDGYSVKVIHE
ncbi:MAG: MBL fold metallo-hydrolase [Candidatus Omnitrophica bacterium]|nr:MBL fold metallo-hydrolase [Candidatus Omnitrophota bacterium]